MPIAFEMTCSLNILIIISYEYVRRQVQNTALSNYSTKCGKKAYENN